MMNARQVKLCGWTITGCLVAWMCSAYAQVKAENDSIDGSIQRSDKVMMGIRLGPQELVARTSDYLLTVLLDKRDLFEQDPQQLFALVDEILLPHFDFEGMSRWVLGKYWRQASDSQQQVFTQQFRELLVRTYGTALLEYTNQSIKYMPLKMEPNDDRVTVRTQILQSGGPAITIDYRLHKTSEVWKVYDVMIDGISLVGNYRSSFASNVRAAGIDGLIAKLKQQNNHTVK